MEYFVPYLDPNKEQVYESPFIRVAHDLGELILDHLNCRVRIFDEKEYNHVELMGDDGRVTGIEINQTLLDYLIEEDFPYLYLPFIDTNTHEWYERCQVSKMNKELGEMGFNE